MSIHKKFEKIWNADCNFIAKQQFDSLDAAAKQVVPSSAAVITVSDNNIRYQHSTIKEVNYDNTLPTPGRKNPGEGKREKKSQHKNSET